MKNSKEVEKYCILQCKKKNHESSSTLKKKKKNVSMFLYNGAKKRFLREVQCC